VLGASDNGWEDGARGVISGKSGLAHTGAVVNDQGGYFFVVSHCVGGFLAKLKKESLKVVRKTCFGDPNRLFA
jgi:hypothetical protein